MVISADSLMSPSKPIKIFRCAPSLDSFSKKVERKLENTLDLFLALEGYTEEGLAAFRGGRPAVIFMDDEGVALALQGWIDFRELLKQEIRHATQTGNPNLRAGDVNKPAVDLRHLPRQKRRLAEKAYVTSIVISEIPIPMRVVIARLFPPRLGRLPLPSLLA
jgi:hypothetical protein